MLTDIHSLLRHTFRLYSCAVKIIDNFGGSKRLDTR